MWEVYYSHNAQGSYTLGYDGLFGERYKKNDMVVRFNNKDDAVLKRDFLNAEGMTPETAC